LSERKCPFCLWNERATILTASAPCTTHTWPICEKGAYHTNNLSRIHQIAQQTADNPTACIWDPRGRMLLIQTQYCSILPGLHSDPREISQQTPDVFGCQTSKEKMISCFYFITKSTLFVSFTFPFTQVVF